jgi:hypothetical protein
MKLINKLLPSSILFSTLLLINGCATPFMTKEECLSASWKYLGYSDGSKGYDSSYVSNYIKACHEYTYVDTNLYNSGRKEGAKLYCVPNQGFSLGVSGSRITDICELVDNNVKDEFMLMYHRGFKIYLINAKLREVEALIDEHKKFLNISELAGLHYSLSHNLNYLESLVPYLQEANSFFNLHGADANYDLPDLNVLDKIPDKNVLQVAKDAYNYINIMIDNINHFNYSIDRNYHCIRNAIYYDDMYAYNTCTRRYQCFIHTKANAINALNIFINNLSPETDVSRYNTISAACF